MSQFKRGDWVAGECYSTGKRLTGYFIVSYAIPGVHSVQTSRDQLPFPLINVTHGDRQEELEFLIPETAKDLTEGKAQVKQLKYELQSAKENVEDQKTTLAKLRAELKDLNKK